MRRPFRVGHLSVLTAARCGLPALIVLAVVLSFLPTLSNNFVNWDDTTNFIDNMYYRGLTLPHLKWMFTAVYLGHYQPIAWLTHGAVYAFWGMNPVGYHLVNLLLHIANALLVYALTGALLRRTGGGGPGADVCLYVAATVGALFFAIHPLRVEVVAWATERRELLSAFFLLLSVLAYLRMTEARNTCRWWLVASVMCYALALLSKVIGMTLPAVLLALDIYPLGRLNRDRSRWIAVLTEKIPYALLAIVAGIIAVKAGAPEGLVGWSRHGLLQRIMQSAYGLCFYLWKTVLPAGLSPLYLLEDSLQPAEPRYILSALVVVGLTVGLFLMARRSAGTLAAWLCYAILVSPVLGLVQAGPQITADRYSYLPSIPLTVLVAATLVTLWRPAHASARIRGALLSAVAAAVLLALGVATYRQTQLWHDSIALWNQALKVDPTNYEAYTSRGDAYLTNGNLDAALADFNQALRLEPGYHYALLKRGYLRQLQGNLDAALADYNQAFIHRPIDAVVYNSRGRVRFLQGDFDGAITDLSAAVRLRPDFAEAYYNRGNARKAKGDVDGALADFNTALQFNAHANVYNNRGNMRQAKGDLEGALADYDQAVRLTPPDGPNRQTFERNAAAVRRLLAQRGTTR